MAQLAPIQRADDNLISNVRKLIAIVDTPYENREQRDIAAQNLARLAGLHGGEVVEILIAKAREYSQRLNNIDDSDPYAPCAFDVISMAGNVNEKLLEFLEETVEFFWGIPRWSAIRTLCSFKDSAADRILGDILLGRYPPKFLDAESDLRVIEAMRGKEFIALLQGAKS